jgi:hypothetical protein
MGLLIAENKEHISKGSEWVLWTGGLFEYLSILLDGHRFRGLKRVGDSRKG